MKFAWVLGLGLVACSPVKGNLGDAALPPIEDCEPTEFVRCNGNVAETCNAAGDGVTQEACGDAGCNEEAARCNQCPPDSARCSTDNLSVERCGADGLPAETETCPLSCTAEPDAHCTYLQPNYAALADICDEPATMPSLEITANQTLDTNADALVCTGGVIPQVGGPAICVLRFGTIGVAAARTLTFSGNRAVALVADSSIVINGTIDAAAEGIVNGPGGGTITSGSRPNTSIGGGGAGFRLAGGDGGSDSDNGGAQNGGAASTNPADLVAFIGGPRPQVGMGVDPKPGGGGGALMLVACRGSVTISATATLDAGGGGGQASFDAILGVGTSFVSGAGGGAGGNIVLQGLSITVLGNVFVNGGGGGGGTSVDDGAGTAGQDGTRDAFDQANGGSGSGNGGGGGQGGANLLVPGAGFKSLAVAGTPGGGGGSVGFLQTYTPAGVTPTLTPASVSPGFSTNRTTPTR